MGQATLRFYAELTDFLGDEHGSGRVTRTFDVPGSVKDMIESCGVPHTEVDLIVVDGESVDFTYRVADGDHISVYPVFESFDVSPILKVRPEPLRTLRFVADNHLRKLARHLRLLGFDTVHDQGWPDPELVTISISEHRILLTRDVELLKHGDLTHGYYVRSTDPGDQVEEVSARFHLGDAVDPFTRCMNCNGLLIEVEENAVADEVPPRARDNVDGYRRCTVCSQVYWKGSHHPELMRIVQRAREAGGTRVRTRDDSGSRRLG